MAAPMANDLKKHSPDWWATLRPEDIGKECEKLFTRELDKFSHSIGLVYHRLPDNKSARGGIRAQPADYLYRCGKSAGFIELKACQHEYRLTKAAISQLPTLRLWGSKGDDGVVVVYHYLNDAWRTVRPMQLDPSKPSWDLSEFAPKHRTLRESLFYTGLFGDCLK